MKLSRVMIAAAALSAGAAQAQIEHLSGASAIRNNVVLTLQGMCSSGFAIHKDTSSSSNLGNIFTAKCNGGNFTGTTVNEARFNVNGGSLSAVINSTAPFGAPAPLTYIDASASCGSAIAGTGVLAPVTTIFHCVAPAGVTAPTNSSGGYMDVEGAVYKGTGLLSTDAPDAHFVTAPFSQTFGVAVSAKLYAAMQEHQTAKGRLPSNCAPQVGGVYTASNIATPDCQPSMSRADYAAMSANGQNAAKRAGANFFIGGTAAVANDLGAAVIATSVPLRTRFTLQRRVATSGTQAASELYFLSNPTGTGTSGGFLLAQAGAAAPGTNLGTTYTVVGNSGSGNVVTGLNSATDFAAGVLSLENNPIGGAGNTYRFVKINNQHGADGVAGAAQTAEAIAGRYDFVYETVKYCPNAVCSPLLLAIDSAVVVGASSPGLFRTAESLYTRGGRSTRPLVTKPS